MGVRLARYLAQAGLASRRKAEDLVAAGLVRVNGRVETDPATAVDPGRDAVECRGEPVRPRFAETSPEAARTLALNKPAGVVTTRSDPGGARTVYSLLPRIEDARLVYVGRLDRDTEGLLLFTTHGTLAHRLTHPRWGVERTYRADVSGALDEAALEAGARRGIDLDDGRTAPFRVRVLGREGHGRTARRRIELVLTEGRNREVRRIVKACGGVVDRLVRTRYGPVTLEGVAPGAWRWLEPGETDRLLAAVGLPTAGSGRR